MYVRDATIWPITCSLAVCLLTGSWHWGWSWDGKEPRHPSVGHKYQVASWPPSHTATPSDVWKDVVHLWSWNIPAMRQGATGKAWCLLLMLSVLCPFRDHYSFSLILLDFFLYSLHWQISVLTYTFTICAFLHFESRSL